jgi:hypothetical protein
VPPQARLFFVPPFRRITPGAAVRPERALLPEGLPYIDVHLSTTGGWHVILPRRTHLEKELQVLLDQMKLRCLTSRRHESAQPENRRRESLQCRPFQSLDWVPATCACNQP